jgi:hypothetical protein
VNGPSKDVFLCHTSADKKNFVEPLIAELEKRGITYWYDKAEVKWGDRLSTKIDEGLKISKFVLVFLSKDFIGRDWPEAELSSALSRENEKGEVVVLPLILADRNLVLEKYQLLRGKKCLEWSRGASAIAEELQSRLPPIREAVDSATKRLRKAPHPPASEKQLQNELLKMGALLVDLRDTPQGLSFAPQLLNGFVNILMRKYGIPTRDDATDVDAFLRETGSADHPGLMLKTDMQRAAVSLNRFQGTVAATKRLLDEGPDRPDFGETVWGNLTSLFGDVAKVLVTERESQATNVLQLIARGESRSVEFKSSMQWDTKKQRLNPEVRKALAKEVSGFMNSEGGTLLIGVGPNGDILGLEKDIETIPGRNLDSLERLFHETVCNHCGNDCYEYVTGTNFVSVYDKTVLLVTVGRSAKPMYYVDGERVLFYVRIGNATRPFNVREAIEYFQQHWQKPVPTA